jgi:hypothetical protein
MSMHFVLAKGYHESGVVAARGTEAAPGPTLLLTPSKEEADVSGTPLTCPFFAKDPEDGEKMLPGLCVYTSAV